MLFNLFNKERSNKRHIEKAVANVKKSERKRYHIEKTQIENRHKAKIVLLEKTLDDKLDLQASIHKEAMINMIQMKDAEIDSLEKDKKNLTKKVHDTQDIYDSYIHKLEDTNILYKKLEPLVGNLLTTSGEILHLKNKYEVKTADELRASKNVKNILG